MRKLLVLVTIVVLAAVGCSSPGGEGSDEGGSATTAITPGSPAAVEIETFTFVPDDITVPAGTTITWTNRDDFAHTVTSGRARAPRDEFEEGLLGDIGEMNAKGTTFSMILDTPGTFLYFCRYHPNMQGSITVTAS